MCRNQDGGRRGSVQKQNGGRHDQSLQKPGWQETRKCAETRMAGDTKVCRNQDGRRHGSVQKPGWQEIRNCAETRMAGDTELCRNQDGRDTEVQKPGLAGDVIKVCRNQDRGRDGNTQKPGLVEDRSDIFSPSHLLKPSHRVLLSDTVSCPSVSTKNSCDQTRVLIAKPPHS